MLGSTTGPNTDLIDGEKRFGIQLRTNSRSYFINGVVKLEDRPSFHFVYELGDHGYRTKPNDWTGNRVSPGRLQQAIIAQIDTHGALAEEINALGNDLASIYKFLGLVEASNGIWNEERRLEAAHLLSEEVVSKAELANEIFQLVMDNTSEDIILTADGLGEALPSSFIAGVATGGDLTSAGRAALEAVGGTTKMVKDNIAIIRNSLVKGLRMIHDTTWNAIDFGTIAIAERELESGRRRLSLARWSRNGRSTLPRSRPWLWPMINPNVRSAR